MASLATTTNAIDNKDHDGAKESAKDGIAGSDEGTLQVKLRRSKRSADKSRADTSGAGEESSACSAVDKVVVEKVVDKLVEKVVGEGVGDAGGGATQKRKITNVAFEDYDFEERTYYKQLPVRERKRIALAENAVQSLNSNVVPLRFKILLSDVDDRVKAIAIRKLEYLCNMDDSTSEYYKTMNWIDALCKLPIGKFQSFPVNDTTPLREVRDFVSRVRDELNEAVYGHAVAKDHIVRLLAQWIINPGARGMVLGISGPMGCGKTTLVKDGIARALGLPMAFVPLGGASDGSYLDGHGFTYEGSVWGRVVDSLMRCGIMNPVLFFDELDKVSQTQKGDEIVNILIHITDSSQNERFADKYFSDIDFDLSKALIIFSYNHDDKINPILKDRMVRIQTKGYDLKDKLEISRRHIVPDTLKQYMFGEDEVIFTDDVLKEIVQLVEAEEGVRNLKRAVNCIVSCLNLQRLTDECDKLTFPHVVDSKEVRAFLKCYTSTSNKHFLSMYM